MTKRNFTILIMLLLIITIVYFGFMYFRKSTTPLVPGESNNFWSTFNPFNKNNANPNYATPPGNTDNIPTTGNDTPGKLKKVSSMPVAGYGVFLKERLKEIPPVVPAVPAEASTPVATTTAIPSTTKPVAVTPTTPPTEFATALRYVDRASGNIFQTFADNIEERKFTTTTIPVIYEALFGNQAQSVVMRYLKSDDRTIATFVGNLPKEYLGADTLEDSQVKGIFLPDNVTEVSISPDTFKIFYLVNSGNNVLGSTFNFLDNKKTQVFNSAFTEWLPMWANGGLITMTTKPSWDVLGYMYDINLLKGNSFNKTLGGVNGLTTLASPSGNLTLYTDNSLVLNVYHQDSGATMQLGVRTLPEKCVWGGANNLVYCAVPKTLGAGIYPDNWYQGEESFNDQLWKINIETGVTTLLLDPFSTPLAGEEIDGIKLSLDNGENYLFFVNKKDSYLWRLDLR
ncbi:MAG: hypothetical protein ABIS26_01725 [Candidatus Paceibacterota bacterium]